ncbi:MAG: D-alanine--D-alanine ligase [Salinibacterium sp.]|nr:D-alanine--D-alanine ligase [Salinibacterium sp.]
MNDVKPSVLVLGGGPDSERPVSLQSAASVASALRASGHEVHPVTIDRPTLPELSAMPGEVIFPVLHGPWGEGGGLQSLIERDGRPFVGCGRNAASMALDKLATKLLAATLGVPTPAACAVRAGSDRCAIEPPVVIKPVFEGSSVGLHLCADDESLSSALDTLDPKLGPWMAERAVRGRELTVGVLASDDGGLRALPIVEVRPKDGAYDFAAKYERDDTVYAVAPELPRGLSAIVGERAVRVAEAMRVRHLARVDFLLDSEGRSWLLEVNTMPGFTSHSLLPMAAKAAGLEMPQLTALLVQRAVGDAAVVTIGSHQGG